MSLFDWLILIIPTLFVMYMGIYSRRYVRDVSDYLAAGRVAGRYVLCMGEVANAISIIPLVAYVEQQYKVGFSVGFWGSILAPLGIILGLLLCLGQQTFGWLKLSADPSQVVVNAYPVQVVWTDIVIVVLLVAAIGFVTSLVTSTIMRRRLQ